MGGHVASITPLPPGNNRTVASACAKCGGAGADFNDVRKLRNVCGYVSAVVFASPAVDLAAGIEHCAGVIIALDLDNVAQGAHR